MSAREKRKRFYANCVHKRSKTDDSPVYMKSPVSMLDTMIDDAWFGEKGYFCDRVIQMTDAKDETVAMLKSEYPDMEESCIRDHLNLCFGKPTQSFFRVCNFWNFMKISTKFNKTLCAMLQCDDLLPQDFGSPDRTVHVGRFELPDDVKWSRAVSLERDSCRFKNLEASSLTMLERIAKKVQRELPARMIDLQAIYTTEDGSDFYIRYVDGYALSTRFPVAPCRILYSKTFYFVFVEPLNVMLWECLMLAHFQHSKTHFVNGNRYFIFFGTVDAYESVGMTYSKENALTLTVRESSKKKLKRVCEEVVRLRNVYAETVGKMNEKWKEISNLVNPKLPSSHVYNFREIKLFTYCYVYEKPPSAAYMSALRDAHLPNLFPQMDVPFYDFVKNKAMRNMQKFAERISVSNTCVCTYSRRPFMERSADLKFMTCTPPRIITSGGNYSFNKLTIHSNEHIKYNIHKNMQSYVPSKSYFENVPQARDGRHSAKSYQFMYSLRQRDTVVFPFAWDAKSNSVVIDAIALGKLNWHVCASPEKFVFFAIIKNNTISEERLRVLRNENGYVFETASVSSFVIKFALAAVNKRKELKRTMEPTSLPSDGENVDYSVVYCSEDGCDSFMFGGAVNFRNGPTTPGLPHFDVHIKIGNMYVVRDVTTIAKNKKLTGKEHLVLCTTDEQLALFSYVYYVYGHDETKTCYVYHSLTELYESNAFVRSTVKEALSQNLVPCARSDVSQPGARVRWCESAVDFVHVKHFWNSFCRKLASDPEKYARTVSAALTKRARNMIIEDILQKSLLLSTANLADAQTVLVNVKQLMKKYSERYSYLTTADVLNVAFDMHLKNKKIAAAASASSCLTSGLARKPIFHGDVMELKKCINEMKNNIIVHRMRSVELNRTEDSLVSKKEFKNLTPFGEKNDCDSECEDENDEEEAGDEDEDAQYMQSYKDSFASVVSIVKLDNHGNSLNFETNMPVVL